jgi:hypothetical protein
MVLGDDFPAVLAALLNRMAEEAFGRFSEVAVAETGAGTDSPKIIRLDRRARTWGFQREEQLARSPGVLYLEDPGESLHCQAVDRSIRRFAHKHEFRVRVVEATVNDLH